MSKESKYDKTYKKTLVIQAYDIILKLLNETQDHYAVHKWYALLLDAKSSLDGVKARIKQLENVKKHMDVCNFHTYFTITIDKPVLILI